MNEWNVCSKCGKEQLKAYGIRCLVCSGMVIPAPEAVEGPDSPPPSDDVIKHNQGFGFLGQGASDDSIF